MKKYKMNYIKTILIFMNINLYSFYSYSQSNDKSSEKIDLQKLEDKYWAAKDSEYGVIQNRTFSKAGKVYSSLTYGPLINDPFAKAKATGLMIGYFLNEDFGLELSQFTYNSSQNDTVTAYETQFGGAKPDYNLVKSTKTISLTYTPFYAKMAFMNIGILYFDMGFTLGIGQTEYEIQKVDKDMLGNKSQSNQIQTATNYEIGFTQQLFVNKNIAFRLDIKNSFYQQTTKQYEIGIGAAESTRLSNSKNSNDTTIGIGLTFFTN